MCFCTLFEVVVSRYYQIYNNDNGYNDVNHSSIKLLIVFERGTLKSIQWNRGIDKVYRSVLQTVSAMP